MFTIDDIINYLHKNTPIRLFVLVNLVSVIPMDTCLL